MTQRSVSQRASPQSLSNRRCSRQYSTTQPPSRQERSSSVSQIVSNAVSRLVSRFTPIVTTTPVEVIIETVKQLGLCGFRPRDECRTVKTFTHSSEAKVSVIESRKTGKTFVFKHTNRVVRDEDYGKPEDQIATWKRCNEAHILGAVLKPYRNVINLLDDQEDYAQPGRHQMILEHYTGGDLVNAIEWWRRRRALVSEQFILHLFIEMAQALAAIHHGFRYRGDGKWYQDVFAQSVIHGDFKEDQIFLRWNEHNIGGMPELVLGDFGAAKVVGHYSTVNPGTWIYHAPEDKAVYGNTKYNFENRQVFYDMVSSRTVQSDIYALGQVMYALAAREPNYWPIGRDPSGLEISRGVQHART